MRVTLGFVEGRHVRDTRYLAAREGSGFFGGLIINN